jgi:hypothetical protein
MVIVGRTKIPYNDLLILSGSELDAIIEGHEIDKRDDWERTRALAVLSLMPHAKKGAKLTGESIMPLPWDKKENSSTFIERAKEKLKLLKENGRIRN